MSPGDAGLLVEQGDPMSSRRGQIPRTCYPSFAAFLGLWLAIRRPVPRIFFLRFLASLICLRDVSFFLDKAVPNQAVLGLILLSRFGRVVNQAKASRLATSKFVAEPEQGDEALVGDFVGFSDHILELGLRDIRSVRM